MAVIQKIRNRAGLLVAIIIGMALIAFILGDMLTSGSALLSKSRANVAVINGKSVTIDEFQQLITEQEELAKMQSGTNTLDEETTLQIRQRAWNELVNSLVMEREYDKLGLTVSGDELFDLINGAQPHPFIRQFFADPNTGIVNRMALNQFLQNVKNLDETNQQKAFWIYLEDMIYKERKATKYNTLLSKGLYTTTLEADNQAKLLNTSVDFSYIVKRYNEIPDSLVNVSENDIKAYYKENKQNFKQEKSRDIRYVVWEVVPSEKDFASAEAWINEIKDEFVQIDNETTAQYVRANSDVAPDPINHTRSTIEDDTIAEFAYNAELGDVYGPYFEENSYKLSKLAAINYLPDSVKASHILFSVDQNSNVQAIQAFADSLMTLIENGADFAQLAAQNSQDQSNAQDGGDLGWFQEGRMVKPFSDSCFYGKTGDVKIVYTQFGLHIVKIEQQSAPVKKVQIATLVHQVRVSEETDQLYFAKASEFGAVNNTPEKFSAAIANKEVISRTAKNIKETDNSVPGLDNSRELIRWAYTASEGDVSKSVMEFENKYVVALLDKAKEKGFTPLEDVRTAILVDVRKEKQAEKLKADFEKELSNSTDINTLATAMGIKVKQATGVKFTTNAIPNLGYEPQVQAIAVESAPGTLSEPISGTNGVYVLQVDNVITPDEELDNTMAKSYLSRSNASRINYSATRILNELAGIEDNRINFF